MTSLIEVETSTLENMAWDVNINLREKLLKLRFKPPSEQVNHEALNKEVETLMNNLDEYHTVLYLRELGTPDIDGYFNPEQNARGLATKLESYFKWRLMHLGGPGYFIKPSLKKRLYELEDADAERYARLFETNLYEKDKYQNHWHMVKTYNSNGEQFIDFGDMHQDVRFVDIIASYKKGFSTHYYSGSNIAHGSQILSRGITYGPLKSPIKSTWPEHPLPQITIGRTGYVTFDL